jgi:hypothetical protein
MLNRRVERPDGQKRLAAVRLPMETAAPFSKL